MSLRQRIEYNKHILDKIFKIIEQEAEKANDPNNIMIKLKNEIQSYAYRYKVFNELMPFTLGEYVRRRTLTIAYYKWREEKKKISSDSSYRNIYKFKRKFNEMFGFSIEEAANNPEREKELQTCFEIEEYIEAIRLFESFPAIEQLIYTNGDFKMVFNKEILLFYLLQVPTYMLPYEIYKQAENFTITEMSLLLDTHRKICLSGSLNVEFTYEDVERVFSMYTMYDFKSPKKYGNVIVFAPKLPDLYSIFESNPNLYIGHLKTVFLRDCLEAKANAELVCISDMDTIEEICEVLGIDNDSALKIVWSYCESGLLRIYDNMEF